MVVILMVESDSRKKRACVDFQDIRLIKPELPIPFNVSLLSLKSNRFSTPVGVGGTLILLESLLLFKDSSNSADNMKNTLVCLLD